MRSKPSRKETTHAAILESALRVFSRKGYRDATIKEIHQRAGCNALTVFRHFQDKETLFYCVVARYKNLPFQPSALRTVLSPERLEEGLRELANGYFRILFENLDILRIFINECPYFPALKEDAWFIAPQLQSHFAAALEKAGLSQDRHITQLFVGYITKLCLEFNTHERIWDYSDQLLASFSAKMERQTRFLAHVIRSLSR